MFAVKKTNQPQSLRKLDEKGNFSLFPGITVVAACYPEHKNFCNAIYSALSSSKLIKKHFSLLPPESYHMTTMDLHTQKDTEENWNDFVTENLSDFRTINETLHNEPIKPVIQKMNVLVGGAVFLTLTLPPSQKQHIQNTAACLDIEDTVPKIFHITLAYTRPDAQSTPQISQQLEAEITEKLNSIIKKESFPMTLAETKLCHFNDMTAFHPWNAQENPFIKPARPKNRFLGGCLFFGKNNAAEEVIATEFSLSRQ